MTNPAAAPHRIDLRQIRHVVTVADYGSVTRAAAALGLAQPTLSEALVRLEADLGAKLFVRVKRGVVLTEAGVAFVARGRQVLAEVEGIIEDVARLGHSEQREVTIGLPLALIGLIGVPLAESMAHAHPQIRLRISEAASSMLIDSLERGRLDLAVCYEGYDFDNFDAIPLIEEDMFLTAAPDNWREGPVVGGIAVQPIQFDELKSLPLGLPSKEIGMRRVLDRFARSRNFEFNPIYELDSLLSLLAICMRASGYAIHAQAAVIGEVRKGDLILVPIENPVPTHTAYLLRRRGQPVSAASLLVEETLVTVLAEMIERYQVSARLKTGGRAPGKRQNLSR